MKTLANQNYNMNALKYKILVFICILLISCIDSQGKINKDLDAKINDFEKKIALFQNQLKLPGLSAIIIKDQEIIWKTGVGYADIENNIPAKSNTQYQTASITKTIASISLLQLVEKGLVDLEMPISDFNNTLDTIGKVKLRHLITHTSGGITPGYNFNYNGNLYGLLGIPMKQISGKSFRTLAKENIIDPIGMSSTIPNPADPEFFERFAKNQNLTDKELKITKEGGGVYNICSLYDYKHSRYGLTYWLSVKLLVGALNDVEIDTSKYTYVNGVYPSKELQNDFDTFFKENELTVSNTLRKMAQPYQLDKDGNLIGGKYDLFFNPGAGYISTVEDLAKFDIALDKNQLISEELKNLAFTPYQTPNGEAIPYGLGWFVQDYNGTKLVWHGGEWTSSSGLYFKIPSEDLTLIILSNSRTLSQAFNMGEGDVLKSGIAMEFFKTFFLEDNLGELGPEIDWNEKATTIVQKIANIKNPQLKEFYIKQLHVMGQMIMNIGDTSVYKKLIAEARNLDGIELFGRVVDNEILKARSLAEIIEVENNFNETVEFSIDEDTEVGLYAIGEGSNGDMYDYGWITNKNTGEVVWKMNFHETVEAGGSQKNRKTNMTLNLAKGDYILHYLSDDSSSYLKWNSPAPDSWFWGIKIYLK